MSLSELASVILSAIIPVENFLLRLAWQKIVRELVLQAVSPYGGLVWQNLPTIRIHVFTQTRSKSKQTDQIDLIYF